MGQADWQGMGWKAETKPWRAVGRSLQGRGRGRGCIMRDGRIRTGRSTLCKGGMISGLGSVLAWRSAKDGMGMARAMQSPSFRGVGKGNCFGWGQTYTYVAVFLFSARTQTARARWRW